MLLTNKKPEPRPGGPATASTQLGPVSAVRQRSGSRASVGVGGIGGRSKLVDEEAGEGGLGEDGGLVAKETGERGQGRDDDGLVWQIGDDDEDEDDVHGVKDDGDGVEGGLGRGVGVSGKVEGEEGRRLMADDADEEDHTHTLITTTHPHGLPATTPLVRHDHNHDQDDDEFGDWEEARVR